LRDPADLAQVGDGERRALGRHADDPGQVGDGPRAAHHQLAGQADLRHGHVKFGQTVVKRAPEHQVGTPDQVADAVARPGVRGSIGRQGLPGQSVGHGQEGITLAV
jgi:hypothetical protein